MSIRDLIPQSKFDDSTVDQLLKLTDEEIKPIIYDLLEWLQDYNWPIAKEILKIVSIHQTVAVPYIPDILKGDDPMWKIWLMDLLVPKLSENNKAVLLEDIKNLSKLEDDDGDTVVVKESANHCLKENYSGL